jgi:hypothetical protein
LSIKLLKRRGKRKAEGKEGSVPSHLNSDVIVGWEKATEFNKRLDAVDKMIDDYDMEF